MTTLMDHDSKFKNNELNYKTLELLLPYPPLQGTQ